MAKAMESLARGKALGLAPVFPVLCREAALAADKQAIHIEEPPWSFVRFRGSIVSKCFT